MPRLNNGMRFIEAMGGMSWVAPRLTLFSYTKVCFVWGGQTTNTSLTAEPLRIKIVTTRLPYKGLLSLERADNK